MEMRTVHAARAEGVPVGRWHRIAAIASVAAVVVTVIGLPASAACHNAAFSDDELEVDESAGEVTLTVVLLGGQPSCEGTVDFQTRDGTAIAPGDYTSSSGELRFVAGDDRREPITVPIVDDDEGEDRETFTVVLSGGTGDISADDTATVTIIDNDAAAPTPTEDATPTEDDTPLALPDDDGGGFPLIAIIAAIVAIAAIGGTLLVRRGRTAGS